MIDASTRRLLAPGDVRTPGQALDDLDQRLKRGPASHYDAMEICAQAREAIAVLRDVIARLTTGPIVDAHEIPRTLRGDVRYVMDVRPLDLDAAHTVAKPRDPPPTLQETAPR